MARVFVPSQNADTQGHGRPRKHPYPFVLDVLAVVSERIAPDDMIAWRLVNRTHAVVTEPYRYCKLVFRTPTRTRDACALLAREPTYARRLQSLAVYEECLGAEDERKELIALVVGLVRRATGLHVLRFENAQDWLGRTGFLDALVSCTQLETLELVQRARVLDPLWHSTHVLFAQLRAPLRVLKLHALGGDGFPAHIFALLKHVAPTLEELDMCNVDIGRWLDRVPVPKPPPVFPCLRTLRMETRSHVHLPTLESAFPAVRALRIKLQGAIHNQLSDYFAQNRPQAPAYWRQLHVLEGDIGGLRSLGLNGAQVDLLSVDAAPVNALDSAALAEVLRGVSPEMLRLLVWPKDEAENVLVYGEYIAPSVRVLELQVSSRSWSLPRILTASSSMEFAMAFMNTLPQQLLHMHSLAYLRVYVDAVDIPNVCYVSPPDDLHSAQAALAQAFFEAVASLSVVTIDAGCVATTYRRIDLTLPAGEGMRTLCFADQHAQEILGMQSINDLRRYRATHGESFDALLVPRAVASTAELTCLFPAMGEDDIQQLLVRPGVLYISERFR